MVQQATDQYSLLVQNQVLGLVWCTPEGVLVNVNDSFCKIVERSRTELLGRHFNDFVHPDDVQIGMTLFQQLFLNGSDNYVVEKRYLTRANKIVWVKINVIASKNSEGKVESILGVLQDITERKKAEELLRQSEANLRFLLNNSDTAFILLDTELRVVTTNKMARQWSTIELGCSLQEGDAILGIVPEAYKSVAQNIMQSATSGTNYSSEDKFVNRNGRIVWYHIKFDGIKDAKGVITGWCIAANETTPYRSSHAEVKATNDLLEQKVKARTAELEIANKELEAFTYSVSHDLMAPLRIIDGFSQVLLDDYKNKLDDEGFQTLQVIKRNANRMGELVNDLLNLARLGRANLIKRTANMQDIVASVIDEMRFTTNKIEAKIKVKDLKPAECDAVLIKQVWSNLVSNAIKYSRTKAAPQIEIGCTEQNAQVVYYIKDNGVGFDVQFSGKLFGVFQRLHKPNEFEGTGVGLAIVHRIITRHGGRVWAEAKVNEGATFYFTLP